MFHFDKKPEDFDFIIHGETRIVLVEKTEITSSYFHYRMLNYLHITVGKTIALCDAIIEQKTLLLQKNTFILNNEL